MRRHPVGSETGLLVAAGDEQALAEAILDVVDHPGEALARAARAHADVAGRFEADHGATGIDRAYGAAASDRGGAGERAERGWSTLTLGS